ncbi:hypothetical protein MYU51_020547 [Penicillium brevicompactum]
MLLRLVGTIRNQNEPAFVDVINLIRSNAPMDEINACLTASQVLDHASVEDDGPAKIPKRSPSMYMDVKRITDIPVFQVPAKPWTSVTADDAFVSHLISLYFTWQQPTFMWVDRDPFLSDMKAGKLGSRFCSPLLVNILLAVACFYSDYPESFANPSDPTTRGEHFFNEAVDLLKKEEGRVPFTTFQAMGDMYTCACVLGKDRLGWQYLVETADCMQQIMSKQKKIIAAAKEQGEQMARSIDVAFSGLSSFIPTSTISFQKPPLIKRPTSLNRLPENHDPNDTWTPYPHHAGPKPAHTNCLLNGHSDLAPVVWDITDYLFGDHEPSTVSVADIDVFHQRLDTVMENLPECIRPGKTSTIGAMDLHMRYHNTVMVMSGIVSTSIGENDTETKTRINNQRMSSARQVGTLLSQYRSTWPTECMPMGMMQYSTLALFTLLEGLDEKQNQVSFVENLIALRALARRWQMAKGMLRLVQLTAIKQEVQLPPESDILLKDFETDWSTNDRKSFSSHYPNFSVAIQQQNDDSIDDVELDLLLEEWDNLAVSAETSENDTSGQSRGGSSETKTSTSN